MKTDAGFNINFELPTSWRHGIGIVNHTGNILQEFGCASPLLVTDKLLVDKRITDPVFSSLKKSGIKYTICDAVDKEPTTGMFQSIADNYDLKSFDSVIAVGGGSVIDVSKGLSVLGAFGGRITDYDGFEKLPSKPKMKIFAIPTTAGTGSEVSDGVVVIDEKRSTKFVVISRHLRPEAALTDPGMTISMPPKVTACTGIDALIHAIEAYLSTKSNMAADLFAMKSIELISDGLEPAFKNGSNLEMRGKMQIGATMAMIAASNTHVGMCHSMDGPISALYHIPHGQACGIVAPAVLEFNSRAVKEKIINVFGIMGFLKENEDGMEAVKTGCDKLDQLLDRLGLKIKLRDIGFQESHLGIMVTQTLKGAQLQTNPVQPTRREVEEIFRIII